MIGDETDILSHFQIHWSLEVCIFKLIKIIQYPFLMEANTICYDLHSELCQLRKLLSEDILVTGVHSPEAFLTRKILL